MTQGPNVEKIPRSTLLNLAQIKIKAILDLDLEVKEEIVCIVHVSKDSENDDKLI